MRSMDKPKIANYIFALFETLHDAIARVIGTSEVASYLQKRLSQNKFRKNISEAYLHFKTVPTKPHSRFIGPVRRTDAVGGHKILRIHHFLYHTTET